MKIKKLQLYTNKLKQEFKFYSEILGCEVIDVTSDFFSVKIGWSELSFAKTEQEYQYHYCFLIPANKLFEAILWMEKRTEIIEIEEGRKTQHFATWNADSFYFYDASGNLAEFIVRHDLKNSEHSDFDISQVLCVNEIGIPTQDIAHMNNQLEEEINTKFWKGDKSRFGTNGDQEGLFLLPNYTVKKTWFPTSIKIKPNPFEAIIESGNKEYTIEFRNEELHTTTN